nr:Retrovirus-related Pol polyprotein from transposon RE1 [Ipomoea batatas]
MTSSQTSNITTTEAGGSSETPNLSGSDSSPILITGHKLNGQNYLQWSQSVLLFICGKGKDDYLTGTAAKLETTEPGFRKWKIENSMIMSWLINSMNNDIGEIFLLFETAQEIWDAAKETYSSSENTSELFRVESTLHDFRQGVQSVTQYYNTLTRYWHQLDLFETPSWKCPEDAAKYRQIMEQKKLFKREESRKKVMMGSKEQLASTLDSSALAVRSSNNNGGDQSLHSSQPTFAHSESLNSSQPMSSQPMVIDSAQESPTLAVSSPVPIQSPVPITSVAPQLANENFQVYTRKKKRQELEHGSQPTCGQGIDSTSSPLEENMGLETPTLQSTSVGELGTILSNANKVVREVKEGTHPVPQHVPNVQDWESMRALQYYFHEEQMALLRAHGDTLRRHGEELARHGEEIAQHGVEIGRQREAIERKGRVIDELQAQFIYHFHPSSQGGDH